MSTVENRPKFMLSMPIDLDEIARMSAEERAELSLPEYTQLPCDDGAIVQY
jgi:hypothetical protein